MPTPVIVSIHQPQYMPWPAYFYKIMASDVFVLFDTVQYPRGRSLANRNDIKTAGGTVRLTVPVSDRGERRPYKDVAISDSRWQLKHWRSIETAYRRAEHFAPFAAELENLYRRTHWESIVDLDEAMIRLCLDAMRIDVKMVRASALDASASDLDGASYILSILRVLKADCYVSGQGVGSKRYIDADSFRRSGIELMTYEFEPPEYRQLWGPFVPGLSVVDTLLNCGAETRALLEQSGRLVKWPVEQRHERPCDLCPS